MKLMSGLFATLLFVFSSAVLAEGKVARSTFTSGIDNREPVDQLGQLSNDNSKVYFFTEITGMAGKKITHRWEHGGEVKAEISFNVGADRWRVWSSKNLVPEWLGEWIVSVVDDAGNTLAEESMAYVPAGEAEATPAAAETAPAAPEAMPAAETPAAQ